MFLDLGTVYAVRADGRVIATAATLPYGALRLDQHGAGGAAHRRRGLATRLLHRCIADITAAGLVPVLDATRRDVRSIAPLGFKEAGAFTRLAAQRARSAPKPATPDAVAADHRRRWPALCAYDAGRVRRGPQPVLARMRGRLPPANLFAERDGRIAGCCSGATAAPPSHLGPLIAEDDAIARALLAPASSAIDGPVYIDLADAKSELRGLLEASGFAAQRPFTRMLLGRERGFDEPRAPSR